MYGCGVGVFVGYFVGNVFVSVCIVFVVFGFVGKNVLIVSFDSVMLIGVLNIVVVLKNVSLLFVVCSCSGMVIFVKLVCVCELLGCLVGVGYVVSLLCSVCSVWLLFVLICCCSWCRMCVCYLC